MCVLLAEQLTCLQKQPRVRVYTMGREWWKCYRGEPKGKNMRDDH